MVWTELFRSAATALYGPGETPALVMTTPHKASDTMRVIDLRRHQVRDHREDLPELWYPNVPVWWAGGPRYLTPEEIADARGGKATRDRKRSYPENTNRFMVLETDTLLVPDKGEDLSPAELVQRKELQRAAVLYAAKASGMPYALAIDSGHKSIHFVFSFVGESEESVALFRQRARLNKMADILGVVLGQLDLNVCRFFGRGWWGRFPYGHRVDQDRLQMVLDIGSPTTTGALTDWARKQLDPEAYQEILHTSRKCTDNKRPFALNQAGWRSAIFSGWEQGRGSGWWQVAKELRRAGSTQPSCVEPPTKRPPCGVWNASYLWHLSAFAYNQQTDGWFFSSKLEDYTPQSGGKGNPADGLRERLRWPDDDYQQLRDEQRSYERTPYDPGTAMHMERVRRAWSAEFAAVVDRCHADTNAFAADVQETAAELVVAAETKGKTVQEMVSSKRKALSPLEQAAVASLGAAIQEGGGGGKSPPWTHQPVVNRLLGLDGQPPLIAPQTIRYIPKLKQEGWYLFRGTHWENVTEIEIQHEISIKTGEQFTYAQELCVVKGIAQKSVYEGKWKSPNNLYGYMAYKNGTLEFKYHNGEYNFYEGQWDPHHNVRHYIDADFLPDGMVPPHIQAVLFRGIKDPGDQESLLQFFGSILVPGQGTQTWGIIEGRGGDGKSAVVDILKYMIGGTREYCSINLHQLGNRFHLSTAEERLLAVDPDAQALTPSGNGASEQYITGTLKGWTGGDEVYLERKGTQGYSGCMDATFLAMVNEKPFINDASHGFWRRMRYWFWDAPPVPQQERVMMIGDHLGSDTQAMDQLRGACFAAFVRACRQGGITVSQSMRDRIQLYQEATNSIASFCSKYLHLIEQAPEHYWEAVLRGEGVDQDGYSLCSERFALDQLTRARNGYHDVYTIRALYRCYKMYCTEMDMPSVRSANKFMARLAAQGYRIERTRRSQMVTIHGDDPKVQRPRESVVNAWCSYENLTNIEVAIASGLDDRAEVGR